PARVFTAEDETARAGWAVLVEGGRILAVGPAAEGQATSGARTIDLPGATLLPGLMDLPSHVFLHPYNQAPWDDQVLKEPGPYRALRGAPHAKAALLSGFTTLRALGREGAGFADLSVKRAIDEGMVPGARLFVATRAIVATAAYGPGPQGF